MDRENVVAEQAQDAQPVGEAAAAVQTVTEAAPENEARKKSARPAGIEALKPGMRFKGKVRNLVEFGAFVDIGVGRDGLAHISTLKKAGIDKTLQVGDTLDVVIRRVDLDDSRISLALPMPEAEQDNKTALHDLPVGTIVTGHVVRLAEFGAFVDIGAQADGLLHVSQLPWGYVDNPSEVLEVGDEVQVRIQEVDVRKRRISLTMKNLDGAASAEAAPAAQAEADDRQLTTFQAAFEKARGARHRQHRARI